MRRISLVPVVLMMVVWFAPNASGYQHPQLGRFMQRDPLGAIDGMSVYQYCGSNPVIQGDPTGTAVANITINYLSVKPDDKTLGGHTQAHGFTHMRLWEVRVGLTQSPVIEDPMFGDPQRNDAFEESCSPQKWAVDALENHLIVDTWRDPAWVSSREDVQGRTNAEHEDGHVEVWVRNYRGLMALFPTGCFCKKKANCYKSALEEAVSAYREQARLENTNYELNAYWNGIAEPGGYVKQMQKYISQNTRKVSKLMDHFRNSLSKCAAMEDK